MSPIQFGILMVPYQPIDVAGPVDVLACSSKEIISGLERVGAPVTAGLSEKSFDIQFHYINETMDPVKLTSATSLPTTTLKDCPELDYLLIGGPDPETYSLSDAFIDFIRKHVESGKVIFTTCTGGFAIAVSGVLDGKNATTNHGFVDVAKKIKPDVNWTKEKRWVVDGNIWTAGGAVAGMDMLAHWVTQNYGMEIAKAACYALDYQPRDADGNPVVL